MKTVDQSKHEYFYEMEPGDIYGNLPELDESKELPYIEIKYRCSNCKGVMYKRFTPVEMERQGNTLTVNTKKHLKYLLPTVCMYCKLTVKPEKMN